MFFNEVRVLIDLFKRLSKVAVSVGILLNDVPKKVGLKTTGDRVLKTLESKLSICGPSDKPAHVGQYLDDVDELPNRFSHRAQAEGDQN